MNEITEIEQKIYESSNDILSKADLKHLKFQKSEKEYIVTLIDDRGYEILKGYGKSTIEAINDLHHNLI